ncbi:YjbH domain-containing protein [Pseudoroseicyclus sp. CLL3-39]|uniref:YjbH domain-containing protein n=2 Tax=Pseudoroseicyclus tamaricis TaxID=2705421 RepID=A0A6B2K402_9RHOB|nr:YjbH domain-containing protein [Pseudoroseicyclus tamaricis]
MTGRLLAAASLAALGAASGPAQADEGISWALYGTPGIIDTPVAAMPSSGTISGTFTGFSGQIRTNFSFQVEDRLSVGLRYSTFFDYYTNLDQNNLYDRSFDIAYQLVQESEYVPAVTVGLRDFLGTGILSSEYVVASKTFGTSVRASAGLGWGRLASEGGFDNPLGIFGDDFDTRPQQEIGQGGTLSYESWFRGPAAIFGGVEWAATEKLTFKAEYSSDGYDLERSRNEFGYSTPLNVGVVWFPRPGIQLAFNYLHGNELALAATVLLNVEERPLPSGFDSPPPPVRVRGADAAASWQGAVTQTELTPRLSAALAEEGLELRGVELAGDRLRVRYHNPRYRAEAQALGRVARILTREAPPQVETFELEPEYSGIAVSGVTLSRSDIEALENRVGGTDAIFQRGTLGPAGPNAGLTEVEDPSPAFTWGLGPYAGFVLFDNDEPLQVELGLQAKARYEITPSLVASGAMRLALTPYREDPKPSDSVLPHVRSDGELYANTGNPGIEYLTLAWYGRPAPAIYSRVTLGYLEPMFGGVSGELLYAPPDQRWALGAEVNYAVQREYEQLFGFRDYDIVTGHVSAYYDFDFGYHAQVDAGRYLAGDWGATFSLDREFENGWKIGGYFTFTDVSFEEFGEGSFDKGVRITVPLDYFTGTPTRQTLDANIVSLSRDGGAKLDIDGRLYETVRDGHLSDLQDGWGRFWR